VSPVNTARGSTLWRESSGSGVVQSAVPMYLVHDGSGNVVFSAAGPEELAYFGPFGDGAATLLDLTPGFIVASGGGYAINAVGPAAAILVDDGAGGLTISTNLALSPAADVLFDTTGAPWIIRRGAARLHAVAIAGNIQLY
jgi:hypothetical protein